MKKNRLQNIICISSARHQWISTYRLKVKCPPFTINRIDYLSEIFEAD